MGNPMGSEKDLVPDKLTGIHPNPGEENREDVS
jgi:hypothetical protein